jgi:hypothetical protein
MLAATVLQTRALEASHAACASSYGRPDHPARVSSRRTSRPRCQNKEQMTADQWGRRQTKEAPGPAITHATDVQPSSCFKTPHALCGPLEQHARTKPPRPLPSHAALVCQHATRVAYSPGRSRSPRCSGTAPAPSPQPRATAPHTRPRATFRARNGCPAAARPRRRAAPLPSCGTSPPPCLPSADSHCPTRPPAIRAGPHRRGVPTLPLCARARSRSSAQPLAAPSRQASGARSPYAAPAGTGGLRAKSIP